MEVKVIGQMDNTIDHTFESANHVYDVGGVSPTINTCGGGGLQPKILEDAQAIRMVRTEEGKALRKEYESGAIHHGFNEHREMQMRTDGVLNTLSTVQKDNYICEKTIIAMRGRNPENPSDRTAGSPTEQRLEPNSQGLCNTLTSVQKDNLVMEKVERFFEQALKTLENEDCKVGDTVDAFNGKVNKSGISPTITTRPEGFKTAILPVVEDKPMFNKSGCVDCDGCSHRSEDCLCDISINEEQCPLLTQTQYRIRKLTPLECWRLMDFTDEDFEKAAQVNSNTQLYKQAGNSIVKNVLVAIIGQMIPGKEEVYKNI